MSSLPLAPTNPLEPFIRKQGLVVLDGGLATALEALGCDLDDDLWSARVLMDDPELIRRVHLDFLEAGADCIATATYQASIPGFRKRGLTEEEGGRLLRMAVDLAVDARDHFWSRPENREGRIRPLVAASVGPYGAYLADGSEYVGRYDLNDEELYAFHRPRWDVLAGSHADLIACETIPSRREAGVLLRLLAESPGTWGWISFSCADGSHLSDGTRLVDVVRDCHTVPGVAAVGINCVPPHLVESLVGEARRGTDLPVLVYPNSGELYQPADRTWTGAADLTDWSRSARRWAEAGADGVGGCCRVSADEISSVRRALLG